MSISKSPMISNVPFQHLGMDYAQLREEGIETIAKLAGNHWTDYNSHDPGITILETLCYAITDLSYRLDFEMEDLFAHPPNENEGDRLPLFLTARDILTVNPLTINDYRKILIDINGIKNAWLEPLDIPQPELYYNANKASLSFSNLNLAELVNLRGLYRVLIEKEVAYQDQELIKAATIKLQKQRNLCEDFGEIRVLPMEKITIKADIEIGDRLNPNQLMAQLYTALEEEVSPSLKFSSLTELIQKGVPVEDIFSGPRLDHGFIEDQKLQQFTRKNELYTSDLIHIILNFNEVEAVKKITISSDRSNTDEGWALDLDPQLTPTLKSIKESIEAGDIKFYKAQIYCPLDVAKVAIEKVLLVPNKSKSPTNHFSQDIAIPTGDNRELSDYATIQNELPLTYGIGDIGLPHSVSAIRKAQAKQLQAYLCIFDQLLANYFAQLDQFKNLFSLSNHEMKTYFVQSIEHFPSAKEIFKDSYNNYLQASEINDPLALERKNRLLDHLIAQYGEIFTDYSLLYSDSQLSPAIAKYKIDFALDYSQISSGRNQAFNYTLDPNKIENFNNVSGLKRRIARLLGIEPHRQFLASSDDTEGFYLVEHILLRPRPEDVPVFTLEESQDFLSFSQSITEFNPSENSGYITCTSAKHGLKEGDQVDVFYSVHYNGTYIVSNVQVDIFDINHEFISNTIKDTGSWVYTEQFPDPFSFQISVVLPTWSGRFKQPNFRQLLLNTLIAETPAHITVHLHWFDQSQMQDFETTYAIWLQQLSENKASKSTSEDYKNRLISLLRLGSSNIQQPPALLGYMTIVEAHQEAIENPFTIL